MTSSAIRTFDQAETRLAEIWPNYRSRPQQQKMAQAVTQTLRGNSPAPVLLAQAGCGVGKSLGYLIPAIASGGRVIVSVSTKALQDQLVSKDLPMLRDTLFPGLTFAVLKGRSNYVCHRAADKSSLSPILRKGGQGERQDLVRPVTDEQWAQISTDAEGCVGKACPFHAECYSEQARNRALAAKVLVVNTSLLTQDLRFRAMTRGRASLLGDFDYLVVDEAHEMADIVTSGLSTRVTLHRIMDTASKLAYHLDHPGAPQAVASAVDLASNYFNGAQVWFKQQGPTTRTAELAEDDFKSLADIAKAFAWIQAQVKDGACSCEPMIDQYGDEVSGCEFEKRVTGLYNDLNALAGSESSQHVVWMETTRSGSVALMISPAEVGGFLNAALWNPEEQTPVKAVLTSATLGVGGDFTYISRRLGLSSFTDLDVGTPFDFNKQARLYLAPTSAPSPKERGRWLPWAQQQMFDLVRAAGGGALLLFTSTSAMREAYDTVGRRLLLNHTVLMQGDGRTNRELAAEFERDRDSVLFATRSFMTGVDFAGDTCRLVVIDKMPFPVPDEPVFKARCEAVDTKFGQGASFRRISIPEMSLVLIQAFGRLIRTVDDSGCVAILDSRMRAGWAAPIRRSLPAAPVIGSIDEVREFYASLAARA